MNGVRYSHIKESELHPKSNEETMVLSKEVTIFSRKMCTGKCLLDSVTRSNLAKAASWGGVQVKLAGNQFCVRQRNRKQ